MLEGKIDEASALSEKYMRSNPLRIRSYQSFGNLYIDFLGDKGGARLSYGGQFTFWDGATLKSYTSGHEIPDMYKEENEAFLQSIDTGVKDKNHIDYVLESARLLQVLYDSSEQNKEIKLK